MYLCSCLDLYYIIQAPLHIPSTALPTSSVVEFPVVVKMMRSLVAAFVGVCCLSSVVLGTDNSQTPKPDSDGKYTLKAEGIRAQFIPYGASISNLFIKDKRGIERDIVLGWDNASYYTRQYQPNSVID